MLLNGVDGTINAALTIESETYFSGNRVSDIHLGQSTLGGLTGDYHSDELDATYQLSLLQGALTLKFGDQPPVNLIPVAANEFQAGDLGTIVFQVAGNAHVSGRTLYSQLARGMTFRKTN